jgi:hypothetical protein
MADKKAPDPRPTYPVRSVQEKQDRIWMPHHFNLTRLGPLPDRPGMMMSHEFYPPTGDPLQPDELRATRDHMLRSKPIPLDQHWMERSTDGGETWRPMPWWIRLKAWIARLLR